MDLPTLHPRHKRSFIYILIGLGLGLIFWFLLPQFFYSEPKIIQPSSKIHAYHDPSVSLEKIRIKAFYILPKNKAGSILPDWEKTFADALKKASEFHQVQFRGKSTLLYDIYPEPVILEKENISYDTNNTRFGNPQALINIANELEKRVFKEQGDLFLSDFAKSDPSEYPVLGFFYEGVGEAGGVIYESKKESVSEIAKELGLPESVIYKVDVESAEGFFILSTAFFTKPEYSLNAVTQLYHEFAHTYGIQDGYDLVSNISTTFDIMGEGRHKPLELMYLDRKYTRAMGLAE